MARAEKEENGVGEADGEGEPARPGGGGGRPVRILLRRIFRRLPLAPRAPIRHRLLALGIAALMLFPILARSGIWDPYELDAGDLARRVALHVFGARTLDTPGAVNALPTLTDLRMGELPFTSMALGFRLFGMHDWTGRLPLALWGFAGVAVLYETVARLVDRRAALYSAIALVTMPLYFMQARTMLGDIVTMSALTLAFCGLLVAVLDARQRWAWLAVGTLGMVAGYFSRGMILGVAVPALAVGLTWLTLRGSTQEEAPEDVGNAIGGSALLLGLRRVVFGIRALFKASPDGPLARSVGFLIQRRPGTDVTFDLMVRQLGHALFPWSAFLPFALGRLFRAPVEAPASARAPGDWRPRRAPRGGRGDVRRLRAAGAALGHAPLHGAGPPRGGGGPRPRATSSAAPRTPAPSPWGRPSSASSSSPTSTASPRRPSPPSSSSARSSPRPSRAPGRR